MSYEVDIRAVGPESKSGDAIALRFGDLNDATKQMVVVIDGGYVESGEDLVAHIKKYYGTEHVDVVISTHPDNDHSSGLRVVLENLSVGHLLMHRPWVLADSAKAALKAARITPPASLTYIQRSLTSASDLEDLAIKKGIPITEPFAGVTISGGVIRVIGPTQEYYQSLIPQFGETPAGRQSLADWFKKVARSIQETWDQDALVEPDPAGVSAVNNSSVILHADFGEGTFLFTADAGVAAMAGAARYAAAQGIDVSLAKYIQIPHHGSKRNIGPALMDFLLGPKVQRGTETGKRAFVSAAKSGAPKHPSKRVTNAVIRRGGKVYVTQGKSHCYHSNDMPTRPNWSDLTPMPFHDVHDEEED